MTTSGSGRVEGMAAFVEKRKPVSKDSWLVMVTLALPLPMLDVREYEDREGRSPFAATNDANGK